MQNPIEPKIKSKLLPFVEELVRWNSKINLIGRKTESEIWENHIRDSLFLLPFLNKVKNKLFLDIGSGGGFPTIPLAILRPNFHYIVTDVVEKKLAWLEYISAKLDLPVKVIKPSEKWVLDIPCTITSRAFSDIKNILKWQKKHAPSAKDWILLKGQKSIVLEELKAAKIENFKIISQTKGCVVWIRSS